MGKSIERGRSDEGLPTGTITFLLTEVEGSTRLWDQWPETMQEAVVRKQEIMGRAVARHAGWLPKAQGEGDSVLGVFARASEAASAALDIQLALQDESWPTPRPLRVRIALHTGEAELRDGDYYGQAINRCARLRSVAHGGQTVLSRATAELLRQSLPEKATLQDLGIHRLRDLSVPEQIFQLCHPALLRDFPPLRSIEGLNHNLPIQLTSFVGRETELSEVSRLLRSTRLLTLTGPGGLGKTRLALEVARSLVDEYPDGTWFVQLESLADPALVPQALASELSVSEHGALDLVEILVDDLRSKRVLLILDNCEHLIGACAALSRHLLEGCPSLKILATSRESLRVPGETTWTLPALDLPDPSHQAELVTLAGYESVRLFVDRALSAKPDFSLSSNDAQALIRICTRLDGMPLGIELAASWVKVLPLSEIADRISDRLRRQSGGTTSANRMQTIHASVDWSYDLLAEPERTLMARLAVFHGGFALEASEEVCAGGDLESGEVLSSLSRLVDKSLALAEDFGVAIRYRMLEVVRQYAFEKLAESKEDSLLRDRHLTWALSLAERAENEMRGPGQIRWLDLLEAEHDNVRAALAWAKRQNRTEEGLRLAAAMFRFWALRGYWSEGREYLQAALEGDQAIPSVPRVRALSAAAGIAEAQGDSSEAELLAERSLSMARDLGDQVGVLACLSRLADLAVAAGDRPAARSLNEECLAIARSLPDSAAVVRSLTQLGELAASENAYEEATSCHEEALAISRQTEDGDLVARSLYGLAVIAMKGAEFQVSRDLFDEALGIGKELGSKNISAYVLSDLGQISHLQGNYDDARRFFDESLASARELGDKSLAGSLLIEMAGLARDDLDHQGARALLEEGLTLVRAIERKPLISSGLAVMAGLELDEGHVSSARSMLEEASTLARQAADNRRLADCLHHLGICEWTENRPEPAVHFYREALTMRRDARDRPGVASSLEKLAEAASETQPTVAARLFASAEALREAIGVPVSKSERDSYKRSVAALRTLLGHDDFDKAWAEGRAATLEDAIGSAINEIEQG